jgi:PEP-CTERM motif
MPILISLLPLLLMLLSVAPAARADFVDVSISGSLFSYDDQTAVTQTSALAGSTGGTAPISQSGGSPFPGSCFSAQANSAICFTQDLTTGSLDTASGNANANVFGNTSTDPSVTTTLFERSNTIVDASKTTFAAAAAFARAGADLSVAGALTGDTPVVDLDGITLFGGTDPVGTLFAFEITNQSPKLTGEGSKVLNNDIRSLAFLGTSLQSILGTPAGWTEANPSIIFYKLVVTLLPDGKLSVSDGGVLGSGFVTAEDFRSGCGTVEFSNEASSVFVPGDCSPGVQTQSTLVSKHFTLPPLPDPEAFTIDVAKIVVASAVPEPSALLLFGSGLLCVAGWRFMRRSHSERSASPKGNFSPKSL